MFKVWLVIFTIFQPHVEYKIQDIEIPQGMKHCKEFVKDITPEYKATEGLVFNLRCEKRSNMKEGKK